MWAEVSKVSKVEGKVSRVEAEVSKVSKVE
jgi:hypothetical protein